MIENFDGDYRKLDERSIPLGKVEGWLDLAILSAVVIASLYGLHRWLHFSKWLLIVLSSVCTIIFLFCAVLFQKLPKIAYEFNGYKIDDFGIEIHTGVVWRRIITVPRSRIQHTDVSQGPIERQYQMATLVLHTAGTTHSAVEFKGISYETAVEVRDLLIKEGDDD